MRITETDILAEQQKILKTIAVIASLTLNHHLVYIVKKFFTYKL